MHWFETEVLTEDRNLNGLCSMNQNMIAKVEGIAWS
jgi:hypothetical protein